MSEAASVIPAAPPGAPAVPASGGFPWGLLLLALAVGGVVCYVRGQRNEHEAKVD